MKSIFSFFVVLIGVTFSFSTLTAVILDDTFEMKHLNGKKVGYYPGSFDPIHLGHQHVIATALQSQYVDYVLVYPAPGGDRFKNRSALAFRQKMIASIYQDHPKVLLSYESPKELQDRFSEIADDVEVIGIMGSDVVTEKLMGPDACLSAKYHKVFMRGLPLKEKHFYDSVGAITALKASAFVVALRDGIDLSHLNGKIYDRPILGLIVSTKHSSTQVRKAIGDSTRFEHLLSFPIQALIKQEGMYGFASRFNVALQQELLEMERKDQALRMRFFAIKNISQKDWEKIFEVDVIHGLRLKEIIKHYGWPGVSDVGLKGTSAMWLLVQHQDHNVDFQKTCLSLLKQAVQDYESPMRHYAYLLDRVNMNQKLRFWCKNLFSLIKQGSTNLIFTSPLSCYSKNLFYKFFLS